MQTLKKNAAGTIVGMDTVLVHPDAIVSVEKSFIDGNYIVTLSGGNCYSISPSERDALLSKATLI